MPLNDRGLFEHYDPEFEKRQRAAEASKRGVGEFLYDQATDPLTYLGGGSTVAGKAAMKGLLGLALAGKATDADATIVGRVSPGLVDAVKNYIKAGVAAGKSPEEAAKEAYKVTGVFKNVDSKWERYFTDSNAQLREKVLEGLKTRPGSSTTLADLVSHDELFKYLPSLKGLKVRMLTPEELKASPGLRGQLDGNEIALNPNLNNREMMSVLAHEWQHGVQNRLGMPGGGNASSFLPGTFDRGLERINKVKDKLADEVAAGLGVPLEEADRTLRSALSYLNGSKAPSGPQAYQALKNAFGEEKANSLLLQRSDTTKALISASKKQMEAHKKYAALHGEAQARVTGDFQRQNLQAQGVIPDMKYLTDPELQNNPFWEKGPLDFTIE